VPRVWDHIRLLKLLQLVSCVLGSLGALMLSTQDAEASTSGASPVTYGHIEYMEIPREAGDSALSENQVFVSSGRLDGQWLTPTKDVKFRVRVYPASKDGWTLGDCILRVEPGFMSYLIRWRYPEVPSLDLVRGQGIDPAILHQGLCADWTSDIPFFEFEMALRSSLSLSIGHPPVEGILLGNAEERAMVMLLGLAGFSALFALLLAFVFGSVRILLQTLATLLLLTLISMRFGGAGEVHLFSSEVMAAYTIPGRIFSVYALLTFAGVLWEWPFKGRRFVYLGMCLVFGGGTLLPLETLRLVHPNPFIFIGGLPLLAAFVLNLYLLVFIRGETIGQVIRILRLTVVLLLFFSMARVTGRLEVPDLVTYWQIGLVFETFATLAWGLKEQRRFVALGESLEHESSQLEAQKETVREELVRVEASHFDLLRANESLEAENHELKVAVDEVSSVERVMNQKRERLHFAELLGFRLAGLGHDLMNPLGLARGIMDLLPNSSWSEQDIRSKDAFIDEIDQMTMLRSAVRIFGRPEVPGGSHSSAAGRVFEVQRAIEVGLELFRFSGNQAHIQTDFRGSALAYGATGDLSRVLVELLSNAERAVSKTTGPGQIKVSLDVVDDDVLISIHDSGAGFPDGGFAASTLGYMNLGSSPQPERFHLGLGLLMCVRLVGDLNGEIKLRETPSEFGGAVIDIRLPLAKNGGHHA